MDNSQGMQHLHSLEQFLLELFVWKTATILHRKFDAVIVADYVVSKRAPHVRSDL